MGKLDKESFIGKKYLFRYYRLSRNNPFLVAIIVETKDNTGKAKISGFNMTRSIEMVIKDPSKFIRITNPNPNDDAPCYVCVDPIKDKPMKYFTRPIRDWDLNEDDIKQIDELVSKRLL